MGKAAKRFDHTKGRTKQADAQQTDINMLVQKYKETGDLTHISETIASYGDFSNIPDFQTAKNIIIETENLFMRLPARVRARVENDPQKFQEFIENPENAAEAIELGLLPDPDAPVPPAPPPEDPPPPAGETPPEE